MGLFNSLGHSFINFVDDYNMPGVSESQKSQLISDAHARVDNRQIIPDNLNSSLQKGFDSISDAITNGLGAYSSSALEFEKEAVKNLQDFNAQQAQLAFERSQSSAREQMDFQRSEREAAQAYNTLMSNTQYQRAVADLKAAGINPIMAVKGLSGSAPTISAMSGASAGSSPASSSKADYTSALSEDKKAVDAILGLLNSSINLFKIFKH